METKICPSCNKEMSATAKFCNGCGFLLEKVISSNITSPKPTGYTQVSLPTKATPVPALPANPPLSEKPTGPLNAPSVPKLNEGPILTIPLQTDPNLCPKGGFHEPNMERTKCIKCGYVPPWIQTITQNPFIPQNLCNHKGNNGSATICKHCGATLKPKISTTLEKWAKNALQSVGRSCLAFASFLNVFLVLFFLWERFPLLQDYWYVTSLGFIFPFLGLPNRWNTEYKNGPAWIYWIFSLTYQGFLFVSIAIMWYEPRFIPFWVLFQLGMLAYVFKKEQGIAWLDKLNLHPHIQTLIVFLVILTSWIMMVLTHILM